MAYLSVAALVLVAAGARDQVLVLFYAVAVFLSFLVGLVAITRFAWAERRRGALVVNGAGAVVVAFTLVMNLVRSLPLVSLGAALLVAGGLYALWVHAGRPRGVSHLVRRAEEVDEGEYVWDAGLLGEHTGVLALEAMGDTVVRVVGV